MAKKSDFFETLNIDESKIKLIKFYCAEKGEQIDIEKEISEIVNKRIDILYRRNVPKVVRHYIENKDKINNPTLITADVPATDSEPTVTETVNESEVKNNVPSTSERPL